MTSSPGSVQAADRKQQPREAMRLRYAPMLSNRLVLAIAVALLSALLAGCTAEEVASDESDVPGDTVARVLDETQQRQQVLHMRGVEEFQAAELHEWDVAPGQFDLQRTAMRCGTARPAASKVRRPRGSPARARRCSAPDRPRRAR
jgi:hypothetical protein